MRVCMVSMMDMRRVRCRRLADPVGAGTPGVCDYARGVFRELSRCWQKESSEQYVAWKQTNAVFLWSYMCFMSSQKRFFVTRSKQYKDISVQQV